MNFNVDENFYQISRNIKKNSCNITKRETIRIIIAIL